MSSVPPKPALNTQPVRLESRQNSVFKKFLELTTSKGLKEHGLLLLSGEKLVREFLQKPHLKIDAEILPEDGQRLTAEGSCFVFSRELFAELDVVGTHFNILVLAQPAVGRLESPSELENFSGLQLICPLGDPGNLGAVLRSAMAFQVHRVLLTEECANPFLPKAIKASAGACLKIPLFKTSSLKKLTVQRPVALAQQGTPLANYQWPNKVSLILGEEGPGLPAQLFKEKISIPTHGVESLNAVVAASIAFFDHQQKQGIKTPLS